MIVILLQVLVIVIVRRRVDRQSENSPVDFYSVGTYAYIVKVVVEVHAKVVWVLVSRYVATVASCGCSLYVL